RQATIRPRRAVVGGKKDLAVVCRGVDRILVGRRQPNRPNTVPNGVPSIDADVADCGPRVPSIKCLPQTSSAVEHSVTVARIDHEGSVKVLGGIAGNTGRFG